MVLVVVALGGDDDDDKDKTDWNCCLVKKASNGAAKDGLGFSSSSLSFARLVLKSVGVNSSSLS